MTAAPTSSGNNLGNTPTWPLPAGPRKERIGSAANSPHSVYRWLPTGFPYTTIAVLLPLNLSHVHVKITSSFVIAFKILF